MKMNQKIVLKTMALSLILSTSMLLQSCKAKEEETTGDTSAVVEEAPVVATDTPAIIDTTAEDGDKPLTNPNEKKPGPTTP